MGQLSGFGRTVLFDRHLIEYHVRNRVKRSTETVSAYAKPYRESDGEYVESLRARWFHYSLLP